MTREELLEERCARFKDVINQLTTYVDYLLPADVPRFSYDAYYRKGWLTPNDCRYLAGLPELDQATIAFGWRSTKHLMSSLNG